MGLSVKWANFNIGASKPEDYGDYYAWGEIEIKKDYSWETYKLSEGSRDLLTKYNTKGEHGVNDKWPTLSVEDDVAHIKLGGTWRMPTMEEYNELKEKCTWSWTNLNGVNGYTATSKINGNSIFIPASGNRYGDSLYCVGTDGIYWSSSFYSYDPANAFRLGFDSKFVEMDFFDRYDGFSVRAVCD